MPEDTTPEARAKIIELIRAMTPGKRFTRALELSSFVRSLIIEDIRSQYPEEEPHQIKARLAFRLYGQKLGLEISKFYDKSK